MGKGTEWREHDPSVVRGFELFCEFNSSRKVSNALTKEGYAVSHATIATWMKKFDWVNKRDRLLLVGTELVPVYSKDLATGDTAIKFEESELPIDRTAAQGIKNYYAKILFDMAEQFINRFKRGEVEIEKFGEFEKAVKLIAILKGIDMTNVKRVRPGGSVKTIDVYPEMSDDDVKKKLEMLKGG